MLKRFILNNVVPWVGYPFRTPEVMPVIYYHNIVNNGEGYSLMHTDVDVFKNHMQTLHDEKYKTFAFSEVPKMLHTDKDDKSVLITFDDGFLSNYSVALPIMEIFNLKFNVFLAVDYIGKENYLSVGQIREMQKSGLVEFGCHTYSHCDCSKLFSDDQFTHEFIESKKVLQDILCTDVNDFCFPFGYYRKEIIEQMTSQHLYERLYTSNLIKPTDVNRCCVTGRIGIDTSWDKKAFINHVEGRYRIMHYYSKMRVGIPDIK